MSGYSWIAGAVLSWMMGAAPSPAPAHIFALFSSDIRGEFPPPPCGISRGGDDPGLTVESLDEVTPRRASTISGAFEIVVSTTCVAPFYQALFAHEPLGITFAFTDADRRPVSDALTLANARLTHVDVEGSASTPVPLVRIGISAASVAWGDAKASVRRERVVSYRASPFDRIDEGASGETWIRAGVDGVSVRLASSAPPMSTAFVASDWTLSVRAPKGTNGAASSTFRVTLDTSVRIDAAQRDQLDAAAEARAALTRALLEVVNAQGTSGITIRLKGASFARSDRRQTRRTIELAANQLTVTDVASGRTASTP